jgi:hypothetical protein
MTQTDAMRAWHRWLVGLNPLMPSGTPGEMILALDDARRVIRRLNNQLLTQEALAGKAEAVCVAPAGLAELDVRVIPGVGLTAGASESRSVHGATGPGTASRSGADRPADGSEGCSRGGLSTRRSPSGSD